MQKGLGIAALVIAIIAIFIPFAGSWLTVIVAAMAAFAYGPGFALAIASLVIDLIHIFFFSPLLWATAGLNVVANEAAREMGEKSATSAFLFLPWMLVGIQVLAVILLMRANKKQTALAGAASPV